MAETRSLKQKSSSRRKQHRSQKILPPIPGDANATVVRGRFMRYDVLANYAIVRNSWLNYEQFDKFDNIRTSNLVIVPKTYVSQKPPWLHTRQGQVRCML